MRIFIPSSKTHLDFDALEKLGTVVPLVTKSSNLDALNPSKMAEHYQEKLREFNYDNNKDIVAMVPPVINAGTLFAVLLAEYTSVQVALFNVPMKSYIIRTLSVSTEMEDLYHE